ncbi:MAG TPA: Gfo/Idh/MocA family oxidoreductase [Acidobacteriaceae bacterium]|nr:Gfo/Idh/MocA family oxidoreductase [Acidobacteriaceae bacterium]
MDLTRRDFGRIAGAGIAARMLSPLHAMAADRKIGYCIIGLGRISMQHFMPAVLQTQTSRITGLVSGHRDKALKMAAQYGVPESSIYSYEEIDKIRDNPAIDAVYVALPNSMHAEFTIRSARAGKHVLCEKPMATSVSDCKEMIQACRQANKKLMIAYRCQLEPFNLRAVQLIREGRLGSVQAIESANGFNERLGEWRLDKKLAGGGPLMDMGIYSLNACRYLTGEEPVDLKGYSSVVDHDGRFDTVEENVSWTMKFPSGIVACCNTTYGAPMPGVFRVHGSKGVLDMDSAFGYEGQHLMARLNEGGGKFTKIDEQSQAHDPSQFVAEADHFSQCVLEDKTPKSPGEEGLRDMELIAKIYASCGLQA